MGVLDYRKSYGFVVVVAIAHRHTHTHIRTHTAFGGSSDSALDKLRLSASGSRAVLAQVKLMCIHLVNISKITPLGIAVGTHADTLTKTHTHTSTCTHTHFSHPHRSHHHHHHSPGAWAQP